jgi:hypothetical protein
MVMKKLTYAVSLVVLSSCFTACAYGSGDESEPERLGVVDQGLGGTQNNNLSAQAEATASASLPVLYAFGLTSSSSVSDPLGLCQSDPGSNNSCVVAKPWNNYLNDSVNNGADKVSHYAMMKGFAKCALETGFTLYAKDGTAFPGEVGLNPDWKTSRLTGTDNHERLSGCLIALLNGDNVTRSLCMISPGAPYNAPCDDPGMALQEGGFFGDLFSTIPSAYVASTSNVPYTSGRVCGSNFSQYCCNEGSSCASTKIFFVSSFSARCEHIAYAGPNQTYPYCASFYSTMEPGRHYLYGFTTYVPAL